MKLHKNLVKEMAEALREIFRNNRYADKVIEHLFKRHPAWGSRDRRFVSEGIYDVVRNYRLYTAIAESADNFWLLTGVWLVLKEHELPDWPEMKHLDRGRVKEKKEKLKSDLPVYESYPDWMWQLGSTELGPGAWTKEAVAMNHQADVFLRVNTLKTDRDQLIILLQRDGIASEPVPGIGSALRLVKRQNVFTSRLFKEGLFEIQDAGSQLISAFLDPQPGEKVIDACAGAGGKSLHIACLMKNKGKVISLDTEERKLAELRKRATRAGASNIEVRHVESNKVIRNLKGQADRILLDVPCSGLGVLKRNPDAKWKLSQEFILKTKALQKEILGNHASMLRPGGTLVYSTCSILPSENEEPVKSFLTDTGGFTLIKENRVYPHEGFDGFYMAMLQHNA